MDKVSKMFCRFPVLPIIDSVSCRRLWNEIKILDESSACPKSAICVYNITCASSARKQKAILELSELNNTRSVWQTIESDECRNYWILRTNFKWVCACEILRSFQNHYTAETDTIYMEPTVVFKIKNGIEQGLDTNQKKSPQKQRRKPK